MTEIDVGFNFPLMLVLGFAELPYRQGLFRVRPRGPRSNGRGFLPHGVVMSKFMLVASYTAEGLKGLRKDKAAGRKAAVSWALESVGGKLEAMYYTLGEHDVVVIADLPNTVSVAGFSLVVGAAGLVRAQTIALITVEEMDEAMKMRAEYRPPGAAPAPIAQF